MSFAESALICTYSAISMLDRDLLMDQFDLGHINVVHTAYLANNSTSLGSKDWT